MIEWNRVTWYSRLAAIIFFIGVLPVLTFCMGKQYAEVRTQESYTVSTVAPIYVPEQATENSLTPELIEKLDGLSQVGDVYECPPSDDGGICWTELLYRGDVNMDGYEDAIIMSASCGGSCGRVVLLYLNQQGNDLKGLPFDEKLGIKTSSANKTELGNITVQNGIITLPQDRFDGRGFVSYRYKVENDTIVPLE
jgi:hypothetical protein